MAVLLSNCDACLNTQIIQPAELGRQLIIITKIRSAHKQILIGSHNIAPWYRKNWGVLISNK